MTERLKKRGRLIGRTKKLTRSEIFQLRIQHQFSFEGIAERLGASLNTIIVVCRKEALKTIQAECSDLSITELTRRANQLIGLKKKSRLYGKKQKMSAEQIFFLRARDKMSFEEIATILGTSPATVRSICIQQARNFFKNAVLPQMSEKDVTNQINHVLGIARARTHRAQNQITLPDGELRTLLHEYRSKELAEIARILHDMGQPADKPVSLEDLNSLYQRLGIDRSDK